jgi:hypothetical protein
MPNDKEKDELLTTPLADPHRTTPLGTHEPSPAPAKPDLSNPVLRALQQRYDILAEVGRDSMGIVYKARDRETGAVIALNVPRPEVAADTAVIERFKSALLLARKITHMKVRRIYELLRFRAVAIRKGVQWGSQTRNALSKAHGKGIGHRDLKPENIVTGRHGDVKVMDLRIARSTETTTTTTGVMVGTPSSVAPEQAEGKPTDRRPATSNRESGTPSSVAPEQAEGKPTDRRPATSNRESGTPSSVAPEQAEGKPADHRPATSNREFGTPSSVVPEQAECKPTDRRPATTDRESGISRPQRITMGTTPYAEPISETMRLVGRQPETVEETRIPINLLEDLALKILYLAGELSLQELGRRMQLHPGVVNEIFAHLRKGQLVEVVGMVGSVHSIVTTSKGQTEAHRIMSRDMYSGPAPVSLSAYVEVIRAQSVLDVVVHRPDLRQAFENLVVSDSMLDQLGAALVSGQSIILYGPTGTGKTVIAEALPRIYKDSVWIPHAVEVQGQIITVFNPPAHRSREEIMPAGCDGRWVLCHRPRVMVGGELTMEMLDLRRNPTLGFYTAPLQMLANNGVLILDDFGRQRISPTELLNRWIVPLDRRIDYLTLAGGNKFEIPFDLIVAFSTNLNPVGLADEAFLRRIQTKINVTYVTDEQFHEIARRVCTQSGLVYDASVVDELTKVLSQLRQPLRACYPRDIIQHICWKAKYDGKQPVLTSDAIREACDSYFFGPTPGMESV